MSFKRTIKMAGLKIRKHSPEILMVVGCASLVGAVGTAIWKTATCDKILDEHEEAVKKAEDHVNEQFKKIKAEGKDVKDGVIVYSAEDAANDISILTNKERLKTVGKMAWHFAPTIALTITSAASFLGAFCIIRGRYTAVCSALAATTSAFDAYRRRVIEAEGEEKDFEYRYGMKPGKATITSEDGKKEKVTTWTAIEEVLPDGFMTFVFDNRSGEYYRDMATNIISLNGIRATMNIDLQTEGFLTARDIFKRLDVWKYLTKEQRREALKWGYIDDGNSYVDFDLYNLKNKDAIMHPEENSGDGMLVLELKNLRPLDKLIA